ncbi:hypothetical protein [Sphingomonas sp.]|uniref:hypothetical protein n=1 Tax=Sphingomonas sp. TaxID=28214 RepID=UPI002DD636C9|nr:hypothetical protein [Sphingomonas sp.]
MKRISAVVLACAAATTAHAEDVDLTGKFPAGSRQVAMLDSLAVERFTGRDGPQLSLALERALLAAEDDGRPHFAIRPDRRDAEGAVTGAVSTGVREENYRKKEKRCVERGDRNKCVREEEQDIPCKRRIVELTASVRVASREAIAWSGEPKRRKEISWCGDQKPSETAETSVQRMIGEIAGELRGVFAPTVRGYSVRFRENTKGLPKGAATRFKAVVKQSQRDLPGACAGWEAIDREVADHVATVFDLGVCAEARGDLRDALTRYERASALLGRGNEAEADVDRVRQLMAAREDDVARGR